MKSREVIVVNKETNNVLINIFKFFMDHVNIELDGEKKIAKVKYTGPNGWKFSFQSSFEKPYESVDAVEVEDEKI